VREVRSRSQAFLNNNKQIIAIISLSMVIAASLFVIAVRLRRSIDRTEPVMAQVALMPEHANTYEELIVALRNEEVLLERRLVSASNDVERHQALLRHRDNRLWARNLLTKARFDQSNPVNVPTLTMVVTRFPDTSEGRAAADLIMKEYLHDVSLETAFEPLVRSESDLALEILRAAYHSSPHPRVKIHAAFSLARLLKTRAERDGWRTPSRSRAEAAEAKPLFEESMRDNENFIVGRGSMAEQASSELEELQTLSVGKAAPEIAGEDTDGRSLQLSDYRGKVVVLAFWGSWNSSCRSMFPYERSLVIRMRGRPFVLLGVSSDHVAAIAQSMAEHQTITWRSWWDGGELSGGPIAQRWNVQSLPDIFIIDHQGVIRHQVGPRFDDHGHDYFLDAQGQLQHRWQACYQEILEVAEALVQEAEQAHPDK
jgi:peroxiredoxin